MRDVSRRRVIGVTAALLLAGSAVAFFGGVFIHAKAFAGQVLLERAFARAAQTGQPARPWGWADTWPVARLSVPAHDISAIVLAGTSGEAMAWGPGHMVHTPLPGAQGTAVIAGHRDTHFMFLQHLRPGDTVLVTNAQGHRNTFAVTDTRMVRWDRSGIEPWGSDTRLLLVTCYPFGARLSGPYRYVVVTEKIEAPAQNARLHTLSPETRMVS